MGVSYAPNNLPNSYMFMTVGTLLAQSLRSSFLFPTYLGKSKETLFADAG